jgi:two-component system sensor histidine kinase BaeS
LSRDFNGENVRLLYHPQDILLEADKGRITQVVSNLLSNAVKFTEKGTINITTRIDEDRDLIVIGVKDTGTGVDPEIGTGLGLFISTNG